jgi:hypothetical protein
MCVCAPAQFLCCCSCSPRQGIFWFKGVGMRGPAYCTTLDDAYFFLNQSIGLPDIPSTVPLRQRYLRACILFSWIALEETLNYVVEELVSKRRLLCEPRGGLLDRLNAVRDARRVAPIDQREFLDARNTRNLLTHATSGEVENRLLTIEQARRVFEYCLKVIRETYPYEVGIRI